MMKRSAIAPQLQAHDSTVSGTIFFISSHNKTPNLMVFRELSFWSEIFLCWMKTEMSTVAES